MKKKIYVLGAIPVCVVCLGIIAFGIKSRNEHDDILYESETSYQTDNGDFEENLCDPEEYVGYELEYSEDFFRIGNEVYTNPEYMTYGLTVKEFNESGRFRNPDLYSFIEQENIILDNEAEDEGISNVPIVQYQVNFSETVSYGNLDFIPVGTQCVLLNKDTLLIGVWGKVLVAYKS